jgi:hypothetical protein
MNARPSRARFSVCDPLVPLIVMVSLACGLGGCAGVSPERTSPIGTPVISNVRFVPETGVAGCAFTLTLQLADPEGDVVVRARASWILTQGTRTLDDGSQVLALAMNGTLGQASGRLTLDHDGTYWFSVQAEDAAGHHSNVVNALFNVFAPDSMTSKRRCD